MRARKLAASAPFRALLLVTALLLLAAALAFAGSESVPDDVFTMARAVVGAGGVRAAGTDFELDATAGQPAAGLVLGPDVALTAGFWDASAAPLGQLTYLPLVLNRYVVLPGPLVLDPISPPEASPSYAVRWSAASLADSYVLERATSAAFTDAIEVYAGTAVGTTIPSQGIARYHYRVKGRNSWGDGPWSNTQAVDVRWESEPNYPYSSADGPLGSELDYYGLPDDCCDYFKFQAARAGDITVDLTNDTAAGVELLLFYGTPAQGGHVRRVRNPPYHIEYSGQAGKYYVLVYATGGYNSTTPYTLRVAHP